MIYVSEKDPDLDDYESPFEPRDVKVKQSCNPKTEYNLGIELGRGKFGVVYQCTEKKTGKKLAAKFITTINKQERENVEREVSIMCELQHPKILQLYDAYDDGKEMCMIMELVEGGELFERVLNEDFELSERACSIFMRQIAMACEYIHQMNVVHLDLKPENVLVVDKSGNRIKIIDFGLARRIEKGKKLQVLFGTFEFVAPEVLAYDNVGYSADMWSVGVICYVLLSGLSPFAGDNDLQTMGNVSKVDYDFEDESFDVISNEAKDFIEKLLVKNPSKRLTAAQALQHPWINPRKRKSMYVLDKTRLRKFVIRRRWHKAILAIRALRRMGANLLNF